MNAPALAIQRAVAIAIEHAGQVYIATTAAGDRAVCNDARCFSARTALRKVLVRHRTDYSAGYRYRRSRRCLRRRVHPGGRFYVTPGVFKTGYFPNAQYMEFVTKLNHGGACLVYSTFLCAPRNYASEVKGDAWGGAYVLAQGGAELFSGGYLMHVSADDSALIHSIYLPLLINLISTWISRAAHSWPALRGLPFLRHRRERFKRVYPP